MSKKENAVVGTVDNVIKEKGGLNMKKENCSNEMYLEDVALDGFSKIEAEGVVNENEVYACMLDSGSRLNRKVGLMFRYADGELSEIIEVMVKALEKAVNEFQYYNLGFTALDCINIYKNINVMNLKVLEDKSDIDIKVFLKGYYACVEELNNDKNKFIEDGYYHLPVRAFNKLVDRFGYNKLSVKKEIKRKGLLDTNGNRPYDFTKRVGKCLVDVIKVKKVLLERPVISNGADSEEVA